MNAQTQSSPEPKRPGDSKPNAQPSRPDFWVDTCRELTHMHIRSPEIIEFHQRFGCRFVPPSAAQAESILAALDAALVGWEKQHPQLFYQALELNFPELVRQSRVAA